MSQTPHQVECICPVLPVSDLQRSIRFYTQTLGFKLDWGHGEQDTVCGVSRDGCSLMLSQAISGETARSWVWIGVEDDTLFHDYRRKGVKVRQEPRNMPWAYEMKFEDPDGNVLWLGTGPRQDLPLADAGNA